MRKIQQIIECLDSWMKKNHRSELGAVEAAEILDKAGILKDSQTRPGKPLRDILRASQIPYAYQQGSKWVIPYSNKATSAAMTISKAVSVPKIGNYQELAKSLLDKRNFKNVSSLTIDDIPNDPGLYAIRIKNPAVLPREFSNELTRRNETLLYVGIASKSLQERLWGQELHHEKAATFFRSIGAVLGFVPPKGSLKGKSNQNNYRFSPSDTTRIIEWIEENLLVNFIESEGDIDTIEESIIKENKPIINIKKNPQPFAPLESLREHCREIARA